MCVCVCVLDCVCVGHGKRLHGDVLIFYDRFLRWICSDFDDCGDNNCQNGATCVDDINGYNCTCAPGYFGVYCEAGNYMSA